MTDYTLREIECFVAVAQELSFTKAAERIHLAQPALSRHIQSLEAHLGSPLFDRTKRRVALTVAGRAFLEEAKGVLPQLGRAVQNAKRRSAGQSARLDLGFASAHSNDALIKTLRGFRRHHPEISISLHDLLPLEQLRAVADGRIDGGFIGTTPERKELGLRFIAWNTEPMRAFVPLEHPLARKKEIFLRELSGTPFIRVSTEAAPFFNERLGKLSRSAKLILGPSQEVSRAQAAIVLVSAGCGATVLPDSLRKISGASAAVLGISDRNAYLTYGFACRRNASSDSLKAFVRFLEKHDAAPTPATAAGKQ